MKRTKLSRKQRRRLLFASDHPSNNRKNTAGRKVQVVFNKRLNKIVQIRHTP